MKSKPTQVSFVLSFVAFPVCFFALPVCLIFPPHLHRISFVFPAVFLLLFQPVHSFLSPVSLLLFTCRSSPRQFSPYLIRSLVHLLSLPDCACYVCFLDPELKSNTLFYLPSCHLLHLSPPYWLQCDRCNDTNHDCNIHIT